MLPDPHRDESGVPLPAEIDQPGGRPSEKPAEPSRVIVIDIAGDDDEPEEKRGTVIEIDLVEP